MGNKTFNRKNVFSIQRSDFVAGIIGIILFLTIIPAYTYATYGISLDDKQSLMDRNDTGIVLYDRNGTPFFSFYQGRPKALVPLSDIPKVAQQALVASEDKDFYRHPGISVRSIARSLAEDINHRNLSYGGSTITQQLIKNSLLNPHKNFLRKYQEAALAYEVEKRYSKDDILEMYLNSVYFGEGTFGIEAASQAYFGKPAKELDLAQSAMLVGLLPAPSRLSPISGNLQEAKKHQKIVLGEMVQQGYITPAQAKEAGEEKLTFGNPDNIMNQEAIHFALMVRDELIQKYGEETIVRSGFKVKTTLNLENQKFAQKVVTDQVVSLTPNRVTNGAAVVIDPKTGEILALVGSRDWYYPGFGQVNVAVSPRQPGSSFKPIYYSVALEKGIITPATILQDVPTDFGGGYKPKDYDGKYRGPVTVRRALSNSLNIPSVAVMKMLGVPTAVTQAQKYGLSTISDQQNYGLSLGLGAGEVKLVEMAGAYGIFANAGNKNQVTDILRIEDKFGNAVYQYQPSPQQVLSPQAAFLISSILSDNQARAEQFGNTLTISRPAAVKTGTTENYRDAWTLGYTPSLVVGAWVGNNDGAPMDNIAGSLGAAPIWKQLTEHILAETPVEKFTPPDQQMVLYNCQTTRTTQKPDPADPKKTVSKSETTTYQEYFLPGTAPKFCSSTIKPTPSTSSTPTPTATSPTPSPTVSKPTPTASPTPRP